jgi:endogenous inhibitor of DNA gyrase (YacG/DUF329 family)
MLRECPQCGKMWSRKEVRERDGITMNEFCSMKCGGIYNETKGHGMMCPINY